jgi:integrase
VEDFTFYAARHTWATIARKLGYDLALINDCLCHKDALQIARTYAETDWEQINAVNRAVMESFVW